MARVSLDLKHFKHVKSDDHSTTLQHKDGHMLTIAHKSLSPEFQEQLSSLVPKDKKSDKKAKSEPKKMADGGRVMMYEGGPAENEEELKRRADEMKGMDVAPKPMETPKADPLMDVKQRYNRKLIENEALSQMPGLPGMSGMSQAPAPKDALFSPQGEAPKAPVDPTLWQQSKEDVAIKKEATDAAALEKSRADYEAAIKQNEVNKELGLPEIPVGSNPMAAQAEQPSDIKPMAAVEQPKPAQPEQPEQPKGSDIESLISGGYKKQLAGINQAAEAQGALGNQQAEILKQQIKAQDDAKASFQQQYQALEQERQQHMADIKAAHINPEKYWDDHSKLAAGIGMILAGFNPAGGENAAINYVKSQINNNIEAQKSNLNSEHNLLDANMRQFGNLKDATDMTRAMMNDVVTHQLQEAAARAQNPAAKAAALQAAGKLQMEVAPMMQQFALRRAMMQMGQQGGDPASVEHMMQYMRVMNPEMAKSMEARYVPTVGMASIPVPEKVREEITAKQSLDHEAQDLLKYSKTHSNVLPGTPEYNFGVTKALALQQRIREAMLGTVFRESEKPLLEKFINENPAGALKMFNTQPQLKAIIQTNAMGLNQLKQSYGLQPSAIPQAAQEPQDQRKAAEAYIKANPNSPLAKKIQAHPKFKGE